jgi:hypothetical protein
VKRWLLAIFLLVACDSSPAVDDESGTSESGTSETGSEPDTRLVDETGVWALYRYSLDGTPYVDVNENRRDKFLLRFSPEDGVVAAAACHEMGFDVDVNSSSCTNAVLSTWSCQCFAYTYEGSTMIWQEFPPGDAPPVVGMDGHVVELSAFGETGGSYLFDSLPLGLFNSDGDISKHVFEIRSESLWTQVDVNGDGVLDLESCSALCFPSEAG